VSAQPSGGPSLWDLLQARLSQHARDVYVPHDVNPLGRAWNAFNAATHLGELGLAREAGTHLAGDLTGSLYAMSAQDTRASNPLDARIAAAYDAGGPGAALEAARTDPRKAVSLTAGAIAMGVDPSSYIGGPLGKLGRVGEIADVVGRAGFAPLEAAIGGAAKLPAPLARAVPTLVQGGLGAAIGAGVGDTPEEHARNALIGAGLGGTLGYKGAAAQMAARDAAVLRARQALYGPVEGGAGNVPRSAGLIGPVPPPPPRAPPPLEPAAAPSIIDLARGAPIRPALPKVAPLPEGLVPMRTPSITGLARQRGREVETEIARRVTPAQERAAADVESLAPEPPVAPSPPTAPTRAIPEGVAPAADRAAALAGLSGRDTNTLLNVAYDHPRAVENAQRKYGDVGALRARAIERIQLDAERVRRLGAMDPDLAARVATLPDVEAAGGVGGIGPKSPPIGGDLTAAQAAYEAAATPEAKLAAERQFVDAYQGAGVAVPAEQVAREGAAEGNRGQSLFQQMRKGDVPGVPLVSPLAAPLEAARILGPGASEAAGRALSNLGTTGGDIRAAFGAGRTAMREAGQAEARGISTAAQAEAAGLGHYVSGPRGAGKAVGDFLNQQRSVIVATPKNQLLDVAHTRGMLREYAPKGTDPAGAMDTIADELRVNEAAPDAYARLSDSLRTAQERWGFKGYTPDLGQGQVGALAQEEAGRILPAAQRVINGTLMELRTKGPVGLLTLPVGAARGYLQPFTDAFFQRLNRLPQRAGRETLYTLTGDANSWLAAHTFLGDLARRGVDVTPLAGKAFTPGQVEALAGTRAANEWRSLLATVWGGAEAETKRVLGDFGTKTALEKVPLIGRMFWLAGWSQRMLPVYAQVAARHPGVSMAVGGALANQAQGLKAQGLNPWDVGGVDTPLGRVNLLSPMPFSGELAGEALSALSGGEPGEAKTPYQTFEGIAGGLGLPINPIVSTAAYVTGLDPSRRPGDLDRYAGVENALIRKGLGAVGLPSPTLQDVAGRGADYGHLLDRAREIVTGIEAGDLKAGKKAPASETDKEWNRLVAERTGLIASDPRNIGAVIDVLARDKDPDTLAAKWYREAEENVAGRQGKQGVVSAVSPLTVSRIDPLARQANIGRTNQPYTYQQISAAYDAGQKKAAQAMQAANTASKAPDQRVYDSASETQRAGLVKDWLKALERRPVQAGGQPYAGLRRR
jgi:hypothetical protein